MGQLAKAIKDLRTFCLRTGLHGYAYAALGELLFWGTLCVAALVWTWIICWDGHQYWKRMPVMTK